MDQGEQVPYFEFTTVSMHGKINNMHNDDLSHRAIVRPLDETSYQIQCSCDPRHPWKVPGINPSAFAIQRSFERHLAGRTDVVGGD